MGFLRFVVSGRGFPGTRFLVLCLGFRGRCARFVVFMVGGFRYWVSRFGISGLRFRSLGFLRFGYRWFEVSGMGFLVLWFRGSRYEVSGTGFRVGVTGFGVLEVPGFAV